MTFGQLWDFKPLFEIHVANRLSNDDGQLSQRSRNHCWATMRLLGNIEDFKPLFEIHIANRLGNDNGKLSQRSRNYGWATMQFLGNIGDFEPLFEIRIVNRLGKDDGQLSHHPRNFGWATMRFLGNIGTSSSFSRFTSQIAWATMMGNDDNAHETTVGQQCDFWATLKISSPFSRLTSQTLAQQ